MVEYDYTALRDRIHKIYGKQSEFAAALVLSPAMLSQTLNNAREWRQDEIMRAAKLLNIQVAEIHTYFFKEKEDKR